MADPSLFLSVDEALERILNAVIALPGVSVGLDAAHGLVAAEAVTSPVDVPAFDNSAYDGYALHAADVAAASADAPATLRVVAEISAGHAGGVQIERGTAARIMTGAPIPAGADTVVPFESTDRTDWGRLGDSPRGEPAAPSSRSVTVLAGEPSGANVRRAGGDVRRGDVVLHRGDHVDAAMVGVLGSIGVTRVPVHPRATVAIVPTGDEIVEVSEDIRPGQVRNSNAWALEARARHYGAVPDRRPIVPDRLDELRTALATASQADLVVTIGGVSMGDHDLVKGALGADGAMDFWQVNMKPGRPLAFGTLNGTPTIGLPGNPVSSMVCFELYVRPALLKLMGHRQLAPSVARATTTARMSSADGKRTFFRVAVSRGAEGLVCEPAGGQDSFRLTSLTAGNGLAIVPEGAELNPGDEVAVMPLDAREILQL